MGGLGSDLGSVVKGEEDGTVLLPCWAVGYYGNSSVASAVGGVPLFLEYAEEVIAVIFPSTIYIDGVFVWGGACLWVCFGPL